MAESFQCPKCGAPVNYERDVIGASLTARCSYCHSSLSVPDGIRPAQVININVGHASGGGIATKWILLIVMIPVIGLIIGAIAMGGFLVPLLTKTPSTSTNNPVTAPRGVRSNL